MRASAAPIRIGISACLLGQRVRFDGGHKRDELLVETLERFAEFVPVCPEVELGLGVPRETLSLKRDAAGAMRLVANSGGEDLTDEMRSFAARRVEGLASLELSGYVLKKDSPSCGMEQVAVYRSSGEASPEGRGLFADALMSRLPNLPVEEEGRLADPRLRENFIECVFACHWLNSFFASRWSRRGLIAFHDAHKPTLEARSPRACAEIERLLSGDVRISRDELRRRYESEFMAAMREIRP